MTCHWFGHSKMNPVDINELFKRKAFNNATDTQNQVSEKKVEDLNKK